MYLAKIDNPLYFFITLTTDEFEGCIAHLHLAGHDVSKLDKVAEGSEFPLLIEDDRNRLKKEIMECDVPKELKNGISTLT